MQREYMEVTRTVELEGLRKPWWPEFEEYKGNRQAPHHPYLLCPGGKLASETSNIEKQQNNTITMSANETQPIRGVATSKDEIIIFSLVSVLAVSIVIHAYYLGSYIWRKRLIYVQGKKRLAQDHSLPPGDQAQEV